MLNFNKNPLSCCWLLAVSCPAVCLAEAARTGSSEQIIVEGRSSDMNIVAPNSASLLRIKPEEGVVPTQNIGQLLARVPGLAQTGEGGLFRVFSVRGLSGQRVRTLIEDVPIWSERAAGNAASFLDPLLMGYLDVLRGPASTSLGSGALGGGVAASLRHFESTTGELGFWSASQERYALLASGNEDLSVAFSARGKDNGQSPDGQAINDHFNQRNLSVKGQLRFDGGLWQYYALAAEGRDIGRANNDYPAPRIVNQTADHHLVLGSRLILDNGSTFKLYAHPNDNDRDTVNVGRFVDTVSSSANDAGGQWTQAWAAGEWGGHVGVDYFTRRAVEVDECRTSLASGLKTCVDSLDATVSQWSGLVDLNWHRDDTLLEAGLRVTRESSDGAQGEGSQQAASGYLGLVQELKGGWRLNANLGSAFRFPTLTEQWFTGTTARGGVVGNPNLKMERVYSGEIGATWQGEQGYANVQLFNQQVQDYIERVNLSLAPTVRSYRNLDDGQIVGLELSGAWALLPAWRLGWQGHHLDGEADNGAHLAEIPADRLGLDLAYQAGTWSAGVGVVHRFEKRDIAATEQAIPAATLLEARLDWQAADGLTLSLFGDNLSDERYFTSADVAEVAAEERRIGLSLRYVL